MGFLKWRVEEDEEDEEKIQLFLKHFWFLGYFITKICNFAVGNI